jgi:2-desacetyl-2-hydroxyethyl bacteriochlorophyllide A dehydrogenase
MKKRCCLYFLKPRQVEVRQEALKSAAADEVVVQTLVSAISPGTEMLLYRGQFPKHLQADICLPGMNKEFAYPIAYGYACVGKVIEIGQNVSPDWLGRLVFAFQPHISHFVAPVQHLLPVPAGYSPETACFLANTETAINLVQDAAPLLGEQALVLGQGIVGLLTTALLHEFPLASLVTADRYPLRRTASQALGVTACLDPASSNFVSHIKDLLPNGSDLTFELSGVPQALNLALKLTGFSGRIIIGSWYGEKSTGLDLGGAFHRSRIKLISSQVSTVAPCLSGRWDKTRRFNVAWEALSRIHPERWITHRFPIERAAEAYHLLDDSPDQTIQIIFDYAGNP